MNSREARRRQAWQLIASEIGAVLVLLVVYAVVEYARWRAVVGLTVAFLGASYLFVQELQPVFVGWDHTLRHPCPAHRLSWARGAAQLWQEVTMPRSHAGPGPLAWARRQDGPEEWLVVRAEPAPGKTVAGYGGVSTSRSTAWLINRLGFQLESSVIRSAAALER